MSVGAGSSEDGRKRKKGAGRGAASLYRNAYRTQLDLTQLADNKASIMISVNGFILSVALASGSFVLWSERRLLVPTAILLVSCLGSMIYAVLAARPRRSGGRGTESAAGRGNLLFYETTGEMEEATFADHLGEVIRDPRLANEEMARHIYGLGRVLIRKFRLLQISYTIFVVGLTLSIVAFLGIATATTLGPTGDHGDNPRASGEPSFASVFEPSGVVELFDGAVLVVEDEADRAITLLEGRPGSRGWTSETPLDPGSEIDDLEGLAVSPEGLVYAMTSHSPTESGERQPERERLVRFRVEGSRVLDLRSVSGLARAMAAAALDLPEEEAEARMAVLVPGLAVEGLASDPPRRRLLVGLRSPLVDGRAVVLPLEGLDAAFDGEAAIEVGERILLDLDGDGVRGIAPDPRSGGLFLVSGPPGAPDRRFELWWWDGTPTGEAVPVTPPDPLPARVEGLTVMTVDGEERVLLVVDDGSEKRGRPASYLLVERDELGIKELREVIEGRSP